VKPTLIGRIHEKLAAGSGSPAPAPRAHDLEQADWLLERIRNTASHFLRLASQNGWLPAGEDSDRHTHAYLLAYKLTLTAWRRHDGRPTGPVLELVQRGVLEAIGSDGAPTLRLLETADADIATAALRFEAGLPGPLTPFYGDLAPSFGGPCPTPELASRYGKIARHLFEGLERRVEERLRPRPAGLARYAGAG
jgi:hypothetical protein